MSNCIMVSALLLTLHFCICLRNYWDWHLGHLSWLVYISSLKCLFNPNLISLNLCASIYNYFSRCRKIQWLIVLCRRFGIARTPPWRRGVSWSCWWIHGGYVHSLATCDSAGVVCVVNISMSILVLVLGHIIFRFFFILLNVFHLHK